MLWTWWRVARRCNVLGHALLAVSEDDMLNFGGLDGEGGADALLESLRSQLGNLRQEEEEAAGGPRMAWAE